MRTDSAAAATDVACESTLTAFETTLMADAACADIADASLLVTLPEPPVTAEMWLDSAFRMLWSPCVETSPTDRADSALRLLLSALCAELTLETVFERTETA